MRHTITGDSSTLPVLRRISIIVTAVAKAMGEGAAVVVAEAVAEEEVVVAEVVVAEEAVVGDNLILFLLSR